MKWNPELYKNKHAFVFDYGESLIELLNPQKEERILDLGCGTGELTAKIGQSCPNIIGMDKSVEMIHQAKLDFKGVHYKVGDASDFYFEEKFNAIFSNATLHWVKNYQAAIKCMYNNLLEGGRIVIEFGGKGNVESIVNSLKNNLAKRGFNKQANLTPWYFPSIGAYSTALENNGFHVTLANHYNRPTKLADNENGIVDWIKMFGKAFFVDVPNDLIEEISNEVQKELKPILFKEDNWFADYKRIRVVAYKEN